MRESHLNAAMEGHFDPPNLSVKMDDDILFSSSSGVTKGKQEEDVLSSTTTDNDTTQNVAHLFPSRWKAKQPDDHSHVCSLPSAPDVRPFTSLELSNLYNNGLSWGEEQTLTSGSDAATMKRENNVPFHNFALNWPGADPKYHHVNKLSVQQVRE